jgi:hypothetical protein
MKVIFQGITLSSNQKSKEMLRRKRRKIMRSMLRRSSIKRPIVIQ